MSSIMEPNYMRDINYVYHTIGEKLFETIKSIIDEEDKKEVMFESYLRLITPRATTDEYTIGKFGGSEQVSGALG